MLLLHGERHPASTARFANVAFSDGSLPFGFLRRIEKRQPISAPNDIRRYFISHEEAGQLCVMAAAAGANGELFFPKMDVEKHVSSFPEIASRVLRHFGYEPYVCQTEEEAKARAEELISSKKWPCHFFASETSGEKPMEEFLEGSEAEDLTRFRSIGVASRRTGGLNREALQQGLERLRALKLDSKGTKADFVEALRQLVPSLSHVETGRNLDQRM